MKRFFDLFFSLVGILLLSPIFMVLSVLVSFTKGPIFYLQERIGLGGKPFRLIKFRTMYLDSDRGSLITVGDRDKRITSIGYFLRKYKLDELPQLFNVLVGEMSMVGPRPEVQKYVGLYNSEQLKVLSVKPGITDWASIKFRNESELLSKASNPERFYVETIMPEKLRLNIEYVENNNLLIDLRVIIATIKKIVGV